MEVHAATAQRWRCLPLISWTEVRRRDEWERMTDYGHDLEFGVFITGAADVAARAVELSLVAERVGIDLVTVQDHPYQPRFLDTWTLLWFVAARTTRIRLTPNVMNLPLRQPAVMARAASGMRSRAWGASPHLRAGRRCARGDDRRHSLALGDERRWPRQL